MKAGIKTSEFWAGAATVFCIMVSASALVWTGKIDSAQWMEVMKWAPGLIGSSYIASRTVAKFVTGKYSE